MKIHWEHYETKNLVKKTSRCQLCTHKKTLFFGSEKNKIGQLTHRSNDGACNAQLQGKGHPDDVLVLGVVVVDPAVLVAAVLTVPLARVLVMVKVESGGYTMISAW